MISRKEKVFLGFVRTSCCYRQLASINSPQVWFRKVVTFTLDTEAVTAGFPALLHPADHTSLRGLFPAASQPCKA